MAARQQTALQLRQKVWAAARAPAHPGKLEVGVPALHVVKCLQLVQSMSALPPLTPTHFFLLLAQVIFMRLDRQQPPLQPIGLRRQGQPCE